jgi:hypothetical protein
MDKDLDRSEWDFSGCKKLTAPEPNLSLFISRYHEQFVAHAVRQQTPFVNGDYCTADGRSLQSG